MKGKELNRQVCAGRVLKTRERQDELRRRFEDMKQDGVTRCQGCLCCVLYVKNLADSVDDERLRQEFSPFGAVAGAEVMVEGGRSGGFGFVRFSSPREAAEAVAEMNGRIVAAEPLYVALAQRKEERRAHLIDQYIRRMATVGAVPDPVVNAYRPASPFGHFVAQSRPAQPLTASMLAAAPPREQKQMLAECLFPRIQNTHPSLAGKITGMLLEIHSSELLHMLQSPESLRSKVDEAVAVLLVHQAQQAAQRSTSPAGAPSV